MKMQINTVMKLSSKYFKIVANYISKNRTPIIIGVGGGAAATLTLEEMFKSKEKQAQQEKDLLYKEALLKEQAKIDAVREENTELKELLNDIVDCNSEAYHEKV